MKKKNKEPDINTESPQKSLEKILKAEIQIAQKISEAKDQAENSIKSARDEVDPIKQDILKQARESREQLLAEGLDEANIKAKKIIKKARKSSKLFYESGQKYIDNAVSNVIGIVRGDEDASI